ncbi:MAG: YggS family pyridoxal phosphate-dependent enzyme [Paracoccaceae bacterium]|tara:strand:+ start:443 stop:1114 length:672 start_codon:yes stop_codon:yes gene_type:complete
MNSGKSTSKLEIIKKQIAELEIDAGQKKGSVKLIAVSKTKPMDQIMPVIGEGQFHFGENKVQEAVLKWQELKEKNKTIELHLLGPLQSNKVKKVFGIFDYIHSLDRKSLAEKISDEVQRKGFCPKIFIQVNTGLEQQKAGIEPENLYEFIKTIRKFMSLNIVGLMCIPPINDIPEKHFKFLKKLADENGLPELSMGMSSDYKAAIKNGATYIRVGTAIFGSRQ